MTRRAISFDEPETSDARPESTPRLDLTGFAPRGRPGRKISKIARAIDAASAYPERETATVVEGQINIRAPIEIIVRFRDAAWRSRSTYAELLEMLLNDHEAKEH